MSVKPAAAPLWLFFVSGLAATGAAQSYPTYQLDGPPRQVETQALKDAFLPAAVPVGAGFGEAVAIDGDRAVVGAPTENGNVGAAYLLERSGPTAPWTAVAEIDASADTGALSIVDFGRSVAIQGDTVVVGAPSEDHGSGNLGAVYLFSFSTQLITAKLVVPTTGDAVTSSFGYDVAISGGRIVVGDPQAFNSATSVSGGAAFVFEGATSWSLVSELFAADGADDDQFGVSVDVDGDYAIVGANFDDDPTLGFDHGSAYLFRRSVSLSPPAVQWTQDTKFVPTRYTPGPLGGPCFPANAFSGWDVQIDGTTIAVSAPGMWVRSTSTGPQVCGTGAVYLYTHDGPTFPGGTWSYSGRLLPSDVYGEPGPMCGNPAQGIRFGERLSLDGDRLAVSSFRSPLGTPSTGGVYVFTRAPFVTSGWAEDVQLFEGRTVDLSGPVEGDTLGLSVAVSDDTVLAGGARLGMVTSGEAYSFALDPEIDSLRVGPAYVKASGGTTKLRLDAGPSHANANYVVYSSENLEDFGFFFSRLAADGTFCCSDPTCFEYASEGVLRGTLDANGAKTLTLNLSGDCGTTRYYAFYAGTVDPGAGACAGKDVFTATFLSDEVGVTFVP